MIYPKPYPSPAVGPKPNSLSAGLPQFDVDKMDVLRSSHPGSVNIEGILLLGGHGTGSSGDGFKSPLI
jgi:hypothetical protein